MPRDAHHCRMEDADETWIRALAAEDYDDKEGDPLQHRPNIGNVENLLFDEDLRGLMADMDPVELEMNRILLNEAEHQQRIRMEAEEAGAVRAPLAGAYQRIGRAELMQIPQVWINREAPARRPIVPVGARRGAGEDEEWREMEEGMDEWSDEEGMEGGQRGITEEMVTEAKTLREKDESASSTTRFSRACLVCVIENPLVRAVFINCGHIVCYPCAVDNARSDATNGKCVFCRQKSGFVKLFEEENDSEKK